MTIKQRVYKVLPLIPKMNLAIGLQIVHWKIKSQEKNVKSKLRTQNNIYANIGCGPYGLSNGWINVDYEKLENVTYVFDCRKNLPFADNSVKGLFCEHFFEHLDYFNDVPYFLASCFRSLQPGGALRIIVPDAEKYLFGYCENGWDSLKKTRPLDDDLRDIMMGHKYETKMQLINEVFRQGNEHKFAWDYETVELVLKQAGFSKISRMEFGISNDPKLVIDRLIRKSESLYVEAIK